LFDKKIKYENNKNECELMTFYPTYDFRHAIIVEIFYRNVKRDFMTKIRQPGRLLSGLAEGAKKDQLGDFV